MTIFLILVSTVAEIYAFLIGVVFLLWPLLAEIAPLHEDVDPKGFVMLGLLSMIPNAWTGKVRYGKMVMCILPVVILAWLLVGDYRLNDSFGIRMSLLLLARPLAIVIGYAEKRFVKRIDDLGPASVGDVDTSALSEE